MNTKLLATALTSITAATVFFAGPATAQANCAVPTKLAIDSVAFPSWSPDVGGTWEALPSDGISEGYCYKQEEGVNANPQVMFNYAGLWYVAIAADCDTIGMQTAMAAFFGASASDPTNPDFVQSIRTMRIEVAADDAYAVEFDGDFQTISLSTGEVNAVYAEGWVEPGIVEREVTGDLHTVELQVSDIYGTVAGFAAHIMIDGGTCGSWITGQDDFEYSLTTPSLGQSGLVQLAPHNYHNVPGSLATAGAQYVWWSDATALGAGYFTIDIDVP